jgi:Protein of unknown function (DUF3102)
MSDKASLQSSQVLSPSVAEHAEEIRRLGRRTIENVIEIGRRLTLCKKEIGHGGWGNWLKQEFDWSESTALRFMQVAEAFGSNPSRVTDLKLPLRAIYLLAAPSTPAKAVEEIKRSSSESRRARTPISTPCRRWSRSTSRRRGRQQRSRSAPTRRPSRSARCESSNSPSSTPPHPRCRRRHRHPPPPPWWRPRGRRTRSRAFLNISQTWCATSRRRARPCLA